MRLAFTKMHGLGNDFVVLDARKRPIALTDTATKAIADRKTGVGCDQILTIEPPRTAQAAASYRIWNADGSPSQQCGNGARCIARLVASRRGEVDRPLQMDSPGGIVQARLRPDGLAKKFAV